MQAIITMLISIASTKAGQAVISWLFSLLWNYASDNNKDKIAKEKLKTYIAEVMADYEKVIHEATEKAKDGLTPEEIEQIRKEKIAIEERLINGSPN